MGEKYLIDSNAVIEFLAGSLPKSGSKWLQGIVDSDRHQMSFINKIELLGFNGKPSEMQVLEDFIS